MRALNWFNRAIVVIVLVGLMILGLLVSAVPAFVAGLLRDVAGALDVPAFSGGQVAIAAIGLPLAALALVVLVLELRVRRPEAVALAGGGGARLAAETVVERLRSDVEAVPEVDQVRPIVHPRRGKVDVELLVTTAPRVDVPTKAAEVNKVARETIERLGLKLGRLSVQLKHTTRAWPTTRDTEPTQPALGDRSERA